MSRHHHLAFVAVVILAIPSAARADRPKRLDLAQVIAKAKQNPLARAAREKTIAARARAREANGARYARIDLLSFLGPSPDIKCVPRGGDCTTTSTRNVTVQLAGVFGGMRLTVAQPLYTFGKLDAVNTAATKAARATLLMEDDLAGDLTYQAARAFYGLKLARELVWMLEEGVEEIAKAQVKLEKKLTEGTGTVTLQDRYRLATLEAEVKARLTEAREAQATGLAAVRALVGDDTVDIDQGLLEAVTFRLEKTVAGYVSRAKTDRADLKAARVGLQSMRALSRYERSRYLPDFLLVGGLSFARAQGVDDPPSAFADDPFNSTGAKLGVVMRWTLDPMSQPARVARARANERRFSALVEIAGEAATFKVKAAHAKAFQAHERVTATQAGDKSARSWVAAVVQADAIGTATAKEIADAYVANFTMHGRLLQSLHDWNLATFGLRRAVGEFRAAYGKR